MTTPKIDPLQSGINSTATDLALSSEYYNHKADECRDLIEQLNDWAAVPDSVFGFSIGSRSVATFRIGTGERGLLQIMLNSLLLYYQAKAIEAGAAYETIKTATDSL